MLVLKALHGRSLARTGCPVADRPSWMRFCRRGPGDAVPDAKALRDLRETPIAADVPDTPFARPDRAIAQAGHQPMAGEIAGATPVAALEPVAGCPSPDDGRGCARD